MEIADCGGHRGLWCCTQLLRYYIIHSEELKLASDKAWKDYRVSYNPALHSVYCDAHTAIIQFGHWKWKLDERLAYLEAQVNHKKRREK